jgi:hypothetical protein
MTYYFLLTKTLKSEGVIFRSRMPYSNQKCRRIISGDSEQSCENYLCHLNESLEDGVDPILCLVTYLSVGSRNKRFLATIIKKK